MPQFSEQYSLMYRDSSQQRNTVKPVSTYFFEGKEIEVKKRLD